MPTKKESNVQVMEALGTLLRNFNLTTVLMVAVIGWLVWDKYQTPAPQPSPVPVVPGPSPYVKTLDKLVGPNEAVELGDFYQSMAMVLNADGLLVEEQANVLKTVGDFDRAHQSAGILFQTVNDISGIAAVNTPIDKKLRVATGTLDPSKSLDDPKTNVRNSLIAVCKNIAEEFNPRLRDVPLNKMRR